MKTVKTLMALCAIATVASISSSLNAYTYRFYNDSDEDIKLTVQFTAVPGATSVSEAVCRGPKTFNIKAKSYQDMPYASLVCKPSIGRLKVNDDFLKGSVFSLGTGVSQFIPVVGNVLKLLDSIAHLGATGETWVISKPYGYYYRLAILNDLEEPEEASKLAAAQH